MPAGNVFAGSIYGDPAIDPETYERADVFPAIVFIFMGDRTMSLEDFMLGGDDEDIAAFKRPGDTDARFSAGARGMMVVKWCAVNMGMQTISLTDAWCSPMVDPPAEVVARFKDETRFIGINADGKPVYRGINSKQYGRIMLYLKTKNAEKLARSTAYQLNPRRYEREYARLEKDGTLDAVIADGWYARFGFTRAPGPGHLDTYREAVVEKMTGTEARFGNAAAATVVFRT